MLAMKDPSSAAFAIGRLGGWEPLGFEAGDNNWYRFVANGPTGKMDPSGLYADLAIEVVSIGIGAWSFCTNVCAGNVGAAAIDAGGIVLDVGLAVVPGAPGGTGLVLKAGREAAERAAREAAEQLAKQCKRLGENELRKLWKDRIHDIKREIQKQFRDEIKKRGFGTNFDIGLDQAGNITIIDKKTGVVIPTGTKPSDWLP